MLTFIPTKYAAGVTLCGDHSDLQALQDTIYKLVDQSPYREDVGDLVLGLAYDVRKAKEGQGEAIEFGFDEIDRVKYQGRVVLWPCLLFQTRLLREFAAHGNTTKLQQSQLYLLEHCIESTLSEHHPGVAQACIDWLNTPFPITNDYYIQYIDDITKQYIMGPQGKARIKKLPKLLSALHPFSDEYLGYADFLEETADEQGCNPHILRDRSEWPEYKV